ncbi:heme anaerobic degradation radical SAM methyltransferase ChuW/HutW [Chelativorans sp. AA-79]|uniref:heme anaerobic degradation radical SAM methyltransferase ChuW/HutW n=1 Tax=Chelativorans sp. AA-79 TaxID=3028735 RepID=UPI0023F96CB2|nr:heme anaerobic degradation radical SAM methyltransferase ChuW/HutW [Chelativorans sp. AA-79]WEX08554.1 heme anaerobic degradation radical SAM methyltransferase ChuW/HutW [Chelativorans sp. AA-79]
MKPVVDISRHFAKTGGDPLRDAFFRRTPVMPWRDKRPLPAEDLPAVWKGLLAESAGARRKRLAYVHVPFCANHCLFCGFYRNAYRPEAAADYVALIIEEIEREACEPAIRCRPVHAVYLGGGTPSALSADELSRILGTIRRCLPLAADCEITVEGRIIHFDAEKIDACLEAGANRFSIGVQTFDTEVRRRQGRRASREEVIRFLDDIRQKDSATLVFDLIYGLPGQTHEVWREDLRMAAALEPDGVDLYGLSIFPGTPLHAAIASNKFGHTVALPELGPMYRIGVEFLAAQGWRQISNSHWARTTRERNLYNLLIKEGADCLAYGSGAGGSLDRYSYNLSGSLEHYTSSLGEGRKPIEAMRIADDLQPTRDFVTAGFEVGRLDLSQLETPLVSNAPTLLKPLAEQWQAAGLLTFDGTAALLTTAGRFWYANLVTAFNDVLAKAAGLSIPTDHQARGTQT